MSSTDKTQETTLFIFAHNDDEFFVRPLLMHEVAQGRQILCVYTTDGAAYGESAERRHLESVQAFAAIGIDEGCIVPLGMRLGVRDGASHKEIDRLWSALQETTSKHHVTRIVTLAWEGGHVDHDTAHLLAVALGKIAGCPVDEFAAYHRFRTLGPLVWCMSLLPGPGDVMHYPVSLSEAWRWLAGCRHYESQRRTFAALIGFCIPQIVGRRRLEVRRIPLARNYWIKPHDGEMLYERRFRVPHREFASASSAFISEHIA
jgi:LmbE family N-acetylglucosaminyl deacetylase